MKQNIQHVFCKNYLGPWLLEGISNDVGRPAASIYTFPTLWIDIVYMQKVIWKNPPGFGSNLAQESPNYG